LTGGVLLSSIAEQLRGQSTASCESSAATAGHCASLLLLLLPPPQLLGLIFCCCSFTACGATPLITVRRICDGRELAVEHDVQGAALMDETKHETN